jgi:Cd(II)/Pb(II)-responsive transcriptional regulator
MRIGELAAATGVEVETIRYYEREKLLAPPGRQSNGYRTYGRQHLERLSFIRHCRALDIPLADISQLIDFLDRSGGDCSDIDRLIEAQLVRVRARLQSMRALERQLTELRRSCDAHQAVAQCGILQELVAAAHGEACVCHGDATKNWRPTK